ncbi:MAG TPA: VOC family protein [Candidatus Saccharimonadales bacterium]|nr:VOC family protein [Candidatus Saccharimonadales bacterium]
MLENTKLFACIAVSDRAKAKEFYQDKLELKLVEENPRALVFETGGGNLLVFISPNAAGTNKATSAAWDVTDREELVKTVKSMKDKGVEFVTYDIPGVTWEDDIAAMNEIYIAWFKDPDGNVLSVGTP